MDTTSQVIAATGQRRWRAGVGAVVAGIIVAGIVVAGASTAGGSVVPPKVHVTTVVTTTESVYEFLTYFNPPAVNISCEIDHDFANPGSPPLNEAYCMSTSAHLTHHVTVSSSGVVRTCVGAQCGSNAGLGTPTFTPGTEVRSGPFTCVISARSVTCREHNAHGFVISATSIAKL